ncbi:ribonuclease HI family protein [Patescibacteria group bacterium]|nr:ribonuclease HI family protein [Patescibacteria group bacterium]
MKIIIYSDGGARGNPGPSGIGAVLKNEAGEILKEVSEYIGVATNNQAEYKAIIRALEEAKKIGAIFVEANLDSELVVKQLNGQYKVKNPGLAPFFLQIYNLRQSFEKIIFKHIRREFNAEADKLANDAMDKGR